MKTKLLFFAGLLFCLNSVAQTPREGEYDQPINYLLIISAQNDLPLVQEQIDLLQNKRETLTIHNLKVFQLTPNRVKSVFSNNTNSSFNYRDYERLMEKDSNFEAVLIDASGTIKYKKKTPMTVEEIRTILRKKNERFDAETTVDSVLRP